MSCCAEKQKIDRLKELNHAKVLACQTANLTNTVMAVIKKEHRDHGSYYEGIPKDEVQDGVHIYKIFRPGDTMAV